VRGKPSYYARWRVPMESRKNKKNPYAAKGLSTTDLDEAKIRAWDWWKKVSSQTAGGQPLYVPTFDKVAQKYKLHMNEQTKKTDRFGAPLLSETEFKRYSGVIDRYLIPYFENYKIDQIPETRLRGYEQWRNDYYVSGPGKNETEITYKRCGKKLSRPVVKSDEPA